MADSPRWQGSQRRIGLTGGIATGKSSAGHWLATVAGLPVLDADRYAREALAPGSPGARAVLERYGVAVREPAEAAPGAVEAAMVLDRSALGRIVFHNPAERRWLEQLVHPLVRARFDQELAALADAPVLVLVVPLLLEAGLTGLCSEVWLVDCDEDQQLQRLIARDHCSEAEARARIAAQWPLARKRPLADALVSNRGEAGQWVGRLQELLANGSPGAHRPTRNAQS
jgi:dephospho-CoA kinase